MTEKRLKRRWLIRIAQEYEAEFDTADEALDFMHELGDREHPGASLNGAKGAVAPIGLATTEVSTV